MSNLGVMVKKLRIERGYTHAVAAEHCGVSPSLFSRLETGRARYIEFYQLEDLAVGLEVGVELLIDCLPDSGLCVLDAGGRYIPI